MLLIAADGAANILHQYKLTPHYIVGDLDSIKPTVLRYYKRRGVKIKHLPSQETTDLEKSIRLALSLKMKHIRVIGYSGKRIDHTLNNFSILLRYSFPRRVRFSEGPASGGRNTHLDIRFLDDKFEIFCTNKSIEFPARKGDIVSLLGMPNAEGITTYGLKYPLNNNTLEFGLREGVSNEAIASEVRINVSRGQLLIFRKHS